MPRLEILFHAAKDGWTAESFDAMTDRLADAFPALEAEHPWLVDLDLAANLGAGVLTVGVSCDDPSAHPVPTTVCEAVIRHMGDVKFEYWQIAAVLDQPAPPDLLNTGSNAEDGKAPIVLPWTG